MTYLSVEDLSKSFGIEPLFEQLTFGISKGDKTALVAPNGTGKSTLLKVLAGREMPDNGKVMVQKGVQTGFLEQESDLDETMSIREYISRGHSHIAGIIKQYEKAAGQQARNFNATTQKAFQQAMTAMDRAGAWDYEQRMQQILGKLNIHQLDQSIKSLSGGERKRVALAFVLLEDPDLLLLDEPTNHLDLDMIEWLEAYLRKSNVTLLMVTHDRYFLDRICNHILEIDNGTLYQHNGNYGYYLAKKAERQEIEQKEIDKAGQLLKKELAWMRRSPKARTTKSKSRISAFYETKEKTEQDNSRPELRLEMNMQRMGSKILELKQISKQFDNTVILDNFTYSFTKGERIGIIGKNGVGKSTFLDIITGYEPADSGEIDKGSTITFGYYQQASVQQLDKNLRVIEMMREIADVVELSDGNKISVSKFLEHFMFTPEMQYTPVAKLSGGERRRLALMKILMKNPNFLILDEPTNDLDLLTLNRLEEFLLNFGGCLILVSHDRFFMDKLVQHYFVFEGNGYIRDFHGTYQDYREPEKQQETDDDNNTGKDKRGNKKREANESKKSEKANTRKLGYKEKKEFQRLEKKIEQLEQHKIQLETELNTDSLGYAELREKSNEYAALQKELDEKSTRWLKLAERAG